MGKNNRWRGRNVSQPDPDPFCNNEGVNELCIIILEKYYTATTPGPLDPISQMFLKLSWKLNTK